MARSIETVSALVAPDLALTEPRLSTESEGYESLAQKFQSEMNRLMPLNDHTMRSLGMVAGRANLSLTLDPRTHRNMFSHNFSDVRDIGRKLRVEWPWETGDNTGNGIQALEYGSFGQYNVDTNVEYLPYSLRIGCTAETELLTPIPEAIKIGELDDILRYGRGNDLGQSKKILSSSEWFLDRDFIDAKQVHAFRIGVALLESIDPSMLVVPLEANKI